MSDIAFFTPPGALPPGGHYTPAVASGGLVFTSGQLPILPDGSRALAEAGFEAQARQTFANLLAVLAAAGCGPKDVLKTTIFLSDIADWPACNTLYAEIFGDHRPARSIVPVAPLHFGYRIEMEAIARQP
jgi:2-iminobutanoate/2-iminopropanoate deaminase